MKVAARLGALVLAVGLVLGALVLRGGDGDGDGVSTIVGGDDVTLTCPSDLDGLCDGLEELDDVRVVRAATATTAEEAGATELAQPWLVTVAWADVVDDERGRAGRAPLVRSEVVATSPVVLAGYEERVTALAAACGTSEAEVTAACLASVADERWDAVGGQSGWGRVEAGLDGPAGTTGLTETVAVAAAVAGPDFGASELGDPDVAGQLRALARSVPGTGGQDQLTSLLVSGYAAADLVVTTEAAVVGANLEGRVGPVRVLAAEPLLEVGLVVVGDTPEQVERAASVVATDGVAAMEAAGWRVDGPPEGTRLGALPAPAERPDGPSLTALRIVWEEASG